MRILNILPYCPVPPTFGGALRVHHLLRLMTRVHEVSVIAYGYPGDEEKMRETYQRIRDVTIIAPPHSWKGVKKRLSQIMSLASPKSGAYHYFYSKEMQRAIDNRLMQSEFDIIQTEAHIMGWFALRSDALKILDAQNVEYDNFRRMAATTSFPLRKFYYSLESAKCRREEIEVYSHHDAVFVTSPRDKNILDQDLPHIPKYVVPNGVDTTYFKSTGIPEEPLSLVFTGSMNYPPNTDAAIFFIDEILPLIRRRHPEVKFHVVGSSPPAALQKRSSGSVVVTGFVDDVRPYIERASVYVVPLLSGGGTRLKVLEALAMKKGIVTTTIGCEGIDLDHHDSVVIADEPQAFADGVNELLVNADLRRKLATQGHELVRTKYDWEVIRESLQSAYDALIPEAAGRGIPR